MKIANEIKSRLLNSRSFEDLESEHCSSNSAPRGCKAQGKSAYTGPSTFYTCVIQITVPN
jgi:hypothetical protein